MQTTTPVATMGPRGAMEGSRDLSPSFATAALELSGTVTLGKSSLDLSDWTGPSHLVFDDHSSFDESKCASLSDEEDGFDESGSSIHGSFTDAKYCPTTGPQMDVTATISIQNVVTHEHLKVPTEESHLIEKHENRVDLGLLLGESTNLDTGKSNTFPSDEDSLHREVNKADLYNIALVSSSLPAKSDQMDDIYKDHSAVPQLPTDASLYDGSLEAELALISTVSSLSDDDKGGRRMSHMCCQAESFDWSDLAASAATLPTSHDDNLVEETFHVCAPPGKLGIVIDTPEGDLPTIYIVKKLSVLTGLVREGDKLIAVDDVDVCCMEAMEISRLLSKRRSHQTRRLTLVRATKRQEEVDAFSSLQNSDRLLLDAALVLTEDGTGDDDLILCALSQSLTALGSRPEPDLQEPPQGSRGTPLRSVKADDDIVLDTLTDLVIEDKGVKLADDEKPSESTMPSIIRISPSKSSTSKKTNSKGKKGKRKKKRKFPKERLEV